MNWPKKIIDVIIQPAEYVFGTFTNSGKCRNKHVKSNTEHKTWFNQKEKRKTFRVAKWCFMYERSVNHREYVRNVKKKLINVRCVE